MQCLAQRTGNSQEEDFGRTICPLTCSQPHHASIHSNISKTDSFNVGTESHEEESRSESLHGPNLDAEIPSVGGSLNSTSLPGLIIDQALGPVAMLLQL